MSKTDVERLSLAIDNLIDGWCERRCFNALRLILQCWPLSAGLTDDWEQLLNGLKDVRIFAAEEITQPELMILNDLIIAIDKIVHRG